MMFEFCWNKVVIKREVKNLVIIFINISIGLVGIFDKLSEIIIATTGKFQLS